MLGLLFPPFVLVGLIPLFYGGRKLSTHRWGWASWTTRSARRVSASEQRLVRDVRRGDRDAFARLVHTYQRRLFGLVLMMVREPPAPKR